MASTAFAQTPPDIKGHWAEQQISTWLDKGLVKGYPDGTFKPDNSITRAEFMVMVNAAFGFKEEAAANFPDVKTTDWFAGEIAKAKAAGYISGYTDGTIGPENQITRQEAAAILAKILKLGPTGDYSVISKFADYGQFPQWSKDAIDALVSAGYVSGYPDNTFKPAGTLTRAEAAAILSNALKGNVKPAVTSYDTAGVYGPAQGMATINGDASINVPGVTLQNTTIKGNLTLAKGIGDGDVHLNNVTVKGATSVLGGGAHSVVFQDCTLGTVTVDRNGDVRIVAEGSTVVISVVINSGAITLVNQATGQAFKTITVPQGVSPQTSIELSGNFASVQVEGRVNISIDSGSTVSTMTLDAAAKVTGAGGITTANINVNGAVLDSKPGTINVASGVTATVAGQQVTQGTSTATTGGGGGGGTSSSDATLSNLTVDQGTLNPTFASTTTSYTDSVANSVYSITVTPTVHNSNASYALKVRGYQNKVSNPISLSVGANTIDIVVTARNGSIKTYTVTVTRAAPPGADATLIDLQVDGTTVTGFDRNTFEYNVELPTGTTTVPTVTAAVYDPGATREITQATGLPGAATVVVTAQDGTTTQTYTINFTVAAPPGADATLIDLQVDGTTVTGFDRNTFEYNVELPTGTTDVPTVTAAVYDPGATREITQATGLPGAATVVVTAQDGTTTQTYTINFTVAAPPGADATLIDLQVDGTTVTGFDRNTFEYNVELPTGTTTVPTVTAAVYDPGATREITQATGLPGAATVVVTAQDGTTTQTYTINFTVAAPPAQTATPSITEPITAGDTSISGTAVAGASVVLSVNGTAQAPVTAAADGTWTVAGLTLAEGDAISVTAQSTGETVSQPATAAVVAA